MWNALRELIAKSRQVVITTHINTDGDGIGSEVALAGYLKELGKEVLITNGTPVPKLFRFLDSQQEIHAPGTDSDKQWILQADLIIILDLNDQARLGEVAEGVLASPAPKVVIDHHPCPEPWADINIIQEQACATGELIYELIMACGGALSPAVATALYVAILTDTGIFRFANTAPRTHEIVAQLLAAGAVPRKVYEQVYEQNTVSRQRLLGLFLASAQIDCGGRLSWFKVTREMFQAAESSLEETTGFADYLLAMENIEVGILFVELDAGQVKVSLRSRGNQTVNQVARRFSGGGHPFAAGMVLNQPLDQVVQTVLKEARRIFS